MPGESQLCLLACGALGETGGLVFALIALAIAFWQHRGKLSATTAVKTLTADIAAIASERDTYKALSLRPPPPPAAPAVHVIMPTPGGVVATSPTSADSATQSADVPSANPPSDPPPSDPDHVTPRDNEHEH